MEYQITFFSGITHFAIMSSQSPLND